MRLSNTNPRTLRAFHIGGYWRGGNDMVRQMMREDEAAESYRTNAVEPIRQALLNTRGRKTEAAKLLGISRSTLWRRMKNLSRSAYT